MGLVFLHPWENFKEKPLPTLSRRTAIDCGVNVIQQKLQRENRLIIANACFEFISYRTDLDLHGWQEVDIFKH